jgi:hypothetical protein
MLSYASVMSRDSTEGSMWARRFRCLSRGADIDLAGQVDDALDDVRGFVGK